MIASPHLLLINKKINSEKLLSFELNNQTGSKENNMAAIEPLCRLFGIEPSKLSKEESLILETETFIHLYKELNEIFRSFYKNYFCLMKFNEEKENAVLEENFIKNIIKDLTSMDEYSLAGIAYHTHIPEEVLQEMAAGNNPNPSLHATRKILELHRTIRFDLYHEIMKKIIAHHLQPSWCIQK